MVLRSLRCLLFASVALCVAQTAAAQIDARMLRYPAVSKSQIAFVYAGDIWLVAREGGVRRAPHVLTG